MHRWGACVRNARPIFLLGFSRGGTNLLLNWLRSHPEVCGPRGETHEVFLGKPGEAPAVRWAKRLRYRPLRWLEGDVFDPGRFTPRPPFRPPSRYWIDRILYAEKLRARGEGQNRWRAPGLAYRRSEIAAARLLCKNVDGLILASRAFAGAFPDATFLALVRNGYAVCEGQAERGLRLEEAARRYQLGCSAIAADAEALERFHVLRYEDLVEAPGEGVKRLYDLCGLDPARVERLRLELKPVADADGVRRGPARKELRWIRWDELPHYVRRDANANQIARLSPERRLAVASRCGEALTRFGYAESA